VEMTERNDSDLRYVVRQTYGTIKLRYFKIAKY